MMPSARRHLCAAVLLCLALAPLWPARAQPCGARSYQLVRRDGRWGAVATRDPQRVLVPPTYAFARPVTAGVFAVAQEQRGGKPVWGLLDTTGRLVLPMAFDDLQPAPCPFVAATQGGRSALYDATGRRLYQADSLSSFYVNPTYHFLVVQQTTAPAPRPNTVRVLEWPAGKLLFSVRASSFTVLSNRHGADDRRTELPFFDAGFDEVTKDGQVRPGDRRLYDRQGRVLFDSLLTVDVYENVATLRRRTGAPIYADSSLRPIKAFAGCEVVEWLEPGQRRFWIRRGGKSGVVTRSGQVLVPVAYTGRFSAVGPDSYLLRDGEAATFFPKDGRPVDLAGYTIESVPEGPGSGPLLLVTDRKTYGQGALGLDGRWVVPARYRRLAWAGPDELIFYSATGDSAGYLDLRGRVKLLARYPKLAPFAEDRAPCAVYVAGATRADFPGAQVVTNVGTGETHVVQRTFLDRSGRPISGERYDWVSAFRGGYAWVSRNLDAWMIDRQGRPAVFAGGYRLLTHFHRGVAIVEKAGKLGLIRPDGSLALPTQYAFIETERVAGPHNQYVSAESSYDEALQPFVQPLIRDGRVLATLRKDGEQEAVAVPGLR